MRVAEDRSSAVSAIDVEPESVALANLGERMKIVHGAGVRGPSRSDDAEGFEAGGEVLHDLLLESSRLELHARVHGDAAKRFSADAKQSDRLVDGVVALGGGVANRPI